jgi:glycine/D-amino acid oxidase-like deaminating enzyme
VIGAGVVGAAVAQRLAALHVEAILLDGAEPGSGATGASFGAVHANSQVPRDYFALCQAAMDEFRRFAWQLAPAPWYHAEGSLVWFRDPARIVSLEDDARRLRDWGYEAETIPAGRVLVELEPGLGIANPETPVAWFPRDAWVDAAALTRRLVERVRNAGGRVLTGEGRAVVAIGREGGRVSGVTLAGGQKIPVAAVVNAAGVNAGQVAAMVARRLPVLAPRSLAVWAALPDDAEPVRRPLRTDGIAMRPDGPGRVFVVPRTEVDDVPAGSIALDDPLVAETFRLASDAIPALAAAQPVAACVAAWPVPDDGLPCVGAVSDIPGYFEAVTDYGVTLAPLIGRSLADTILGRGGNPLLEPFSPNRFAQA